MDLKAIMDELKNWSPSERRRLIEKLWDGLEEVHSQELANDLKDLLNRRHEALSDDRKPIPWEEVEARATARYGR